MGRRSTLKLQNFTDRSNICKLRISAHCLAIEQGCYTSPMTPRNERVCLYCLFKNNTPVIESEAHVLNECPLYSIPRKKYETYTNIPILDVLKYSHSAPEQRKLGKLCTSIFDINESFRAYAKENFDQTVLENPPTCIIL